MDILLNILFVAIFLAALAGLAWSTRRDTFATHPRTRHFD
jgi:hypothetical protein